MWNILKEWTLFDLFFLNPDGVFACRRRVDESLIQPHFMSSNKEYKAIIYTFSGNVTDTFLNPMHLYPFSTKKSVSILLFTTGNTNAKLLLVSAVTVRDVADC